MSGVAPQQRFTRAFRCPICQGCYEDPQGKGIRCYGFLSSDGKYAHCTREEYAGRIERHADSETYPHSLQGDCHCGRAHGLAVAPPLPARREPRHPPPGAIAAYRYESPEGHLAYIVLRYANPKIFLPCHAAVEDPQITECTHWWVDLEGVHDRFLYRLPELLAADPDEIVFYTEGEKDADRLIAEGLVATTNALGARSWVPEYAEALRGRRVVLLGDNDDDGREGAKKKAEHLQGVAASVQVVIFSELRKGGDVSDWLDEGHTAQELLTRVNASWPSADTTKKKPFPLVITLRQLLAKKIPAERLIVDGVLPEGCTLLIGKPKMRKTFCAEGICIAVGAGGKAFGQIGVERGDALYLCLEDGEALTQLRCRQLASNDLAHDTVHWAFEWPRVDDGGLEALDSWIIGHPNTRLVVVDTLQRIRPPAVGHHAYNEDYKAVQGLQALAGKHRIAILVIHHARKMAADDRIDSAIGTAGLTGAVDGVLVLETNRRENDATLTVIHRRSEDKELALVWDQTILQWVLAGTREEYLLGKERQEIVDAIIQNGDPMTPKETALSIEKNYWTTKNLIRKMAIDGVLAAAGGGRYRVGDDHVVRGISSNVTSRSPISLFGQQEADSGDYGGATRGYAGLRGATAGLRTEKGDLSRQDATNDDSGYSGDTFLDSLENGVESDFDEEPFS